MGLKPETSLTVALATAALVWGVYSTHLPSVSDTRAAPQNNQVVDSSRKTATWTAAGIVAGVSLIAHDPNVFILGGAILVVLDFTHRSANAVTPGANKVLPNISGSANFSAGA
jgi:hypothetical protein